MGNHRYSCRRRGNLLAIIVAFPRAREKARVSRRERELEGQPGTSGYRNREAAASRARRAEEAEYRARIANKRHSGIAQRLSYARKRPPCTSGNGRPRAD